LALGTLLYLLTIHRVEALIESERKLLRPEFLARGGNFGEDKQTCSELNFDDLNGRFCARQEK
jgi:hypothetical protein